MASLRIHAKKRKASSPLPIAVALGQRKRRFANVESYLGLWFAKAVGGGFTFFDAKNEEPNRTNEMTGMKLMKIHSTPLPMSCMRRTLIAKPGTNIAR